MAFVTPWRGVIICLVISCLGLGSCRGRGRERWVWFWWKSRFEEAWFGVWRSWGYGIGVVERAVLVGLSLLALGMRGL